jgi:hypothetical protein
VFGIESISSAVAVLRLIFWITIESSLLDGAPAAAVVGLAFSTEVVGLDVAVVSEFVGGTTVAWAIATVAGALVGALGVA